MSASVDENGKHKSLKWFWGGTLVFASSSRRRHQRRSGYVGSWIAACRHSLYAISVSVFTVLVVASSDRFSNGGFLAEPPSRSWEGHLEHSVGVGPYYVVGDRTT